MILYKTNKYKKVVFCVAVLTFTSWWLFARYAANRIFYLSLILFWLDSISIIDLGKVIPVVI